MSTCNTYAPLRSPSPPDRDVRDPGIARREAGPLKVPGRKAHICFVAPHTWPVLSNARDIEVVGGAEVQQSFIARALASRGYRVSMICLDYGQPEAAEVDGVTVYKAYRPDEGVPVLRFIHPRITSVWKAMKRINADVYYQRSSAMVTGVMALFCRRHGKKSIYAGASDVDFVPGREEIRFARDRWIFEYGLRHVDGIVVQNPSQADSCRRHYGREPMLVPSCYVPPGAVRADRKGYVLWVGAMRPAKRPERLLEIARRLPQYEFVMIGRADLDRRGQERDRAFREAAGMLPNLKVMGFLPYRIADRYFDGAAVHLNTSAYEGFPNTFLQAWARGIPTVGFTDTGSREGIDPVYDVVDDVEAAAERIDRLMRDDIHWQAMSQRVARHFRARHSVEAVVAHYEQVLDTLWRPC